MDIEFGDLLGQQRDRAGLTQQQLLNALWHDYEFETRDRGGHIKLKYTAADVSKWENGTTKPPESVVCALEEILRVPKGLLLHAAGYDNRAALERLRAEGTGQDANAFLDVTERWKNQLQYPFPSQLLWQSSTDRIRQDVLDQLFEDKELASLYEHVQRLHLRSIGEPFRISLTIESEPLFRKVREQFHRDPVWESYDSWCQQYVCYIDAFFAWHVRLENTIRDGFCYALADGAAEFEGKNARDKVALVKERLEEARSDPKFRNDAVQLEAALQVLPLLVGCDLLTLRCATLSANCCCVHEVAQLRLLRQVLTSLVSGAAKSFISAKHILNVSYVILSDPDDGYEVRGKTDRLLQRLTELQTTQNTLHSEIAALQDRILNGFY